MHIIVVGVKGSLPMYFTEDIKIEQVRLCYLRSIETHQNLVQHVAHRISD